MNLSNYPPGVTGREYAISGATNEWEEERECPSCGWVGIMHHETHPEFGVWAWCGNPSAPDSWCTVEGFDATDDEPDYYVPDYMDEEDARGR